MLVEMRQQQAMASKANLPLLRDDVIFHARKLIFETDLSFAGEHELLSEKQGRSESLALRSGTSSSIGRCNLPPTRLVISQLPCCFR